MLQTNDRYVKGGLSLDQVSKIIDCRLKGNVDIKNKSSIVVDSDITETDVDSSTIFQSSVSGSFLNYSGVIDSQVVKSVMYGGFALGSTLSNTVAIEDVFVHDAFVFRSKLYTGTRILTGVIRESELKDFCVVTKATVEGCKLRSAIVEEGVKLYNLESDDPDYYFKHGIWNRLPVVVRDNHLRYLISEDVNDRILVGCQSRPASFWLDMTREQASKFGNEFAENFHSYRSAFFDIQRLRLNGDIKSPEWSEDNIKPNTEEYELDIQVAQEDYAVAGMGNGK